MAWSERFPIYLSSPFQVLWWETDELGIFFMFLIFALVFGGFGYLAMLVGPWVYSHFKKKYPRGFLRHTLYFVGIVKMEGYPIYFEKEFKE